MEMIWLVIFFIFFAPSSAKNLNPIWFLSSKKKLLRAMWCLPDYKTMACPGRTSIAPS